MHFTEDDLNESLSSEQHFSKTKIRVINEMKTNRINIDQDFPFEFFITIAGHFSSGC